MILANQGYEHVLNYSQHTPQTQGVACRKLEFGIPLSWIHEEMPGTTYECRKIVISPDLGRLALNLSNGTISKEWLHQ